MKWLPMLLGLSGLVLLSTGCFSTPLRDASVAPGEKHDEWRSFFFWGLAGKAEVDVREFCQGGDVHEVATGTNFGTWVATGLTLGIYSPEKVYVTCGAPSGATATAATKAVAQ